MVELGEAERNLRVEGRSVAMRDANSLASGRGREMADIADVSISVEMSMPKNRVSG